MTNKGFKADLADVPSYRLKECKKEIYHVLGLKSTAQFYRKRNGQTPLNPAEAVVVKEVIEKYKN